MIFTSPTDLEYADMEKFDVDCDHNCDECWFDCGDDL